MINLDLLDELPQSARYHLADVCEFALPCGWCLSLKSSIFKLRHYLLAYEEQRSDEPLTIRHVANDGKGAARGAFTSMRLSSRRER